MRPVLACGNVAHITAWATERLALDHIRLVTAAPNQPWTQQVLELQPDAVILGVGEDSTYAATVCSEIRRETGAGVLILALTYSERQIVTLLDAGADDYMVPNNNQEELVARIRALLRRTARASGQRTYCLDDLLIDVENRKVQVGEREVMLTPLEFRLLACLAANAGRSLSPATLIRAVQGYPTGEQEATHIIKALVWRLRKKLEDDPSKPYYVRNVRGSGYILEPHPASRPAGTAHTASTP